MIRSINNKNVKRSVRSIGTYAYLGRSVGVAKVARTDKAKNIAKARTIRGRDSPSKRNKPNAKKNAI